MRFNSYKVKTWFSCVPIPIALFLLCACLGHAQSGRGTLTGSVKDTSGAVLPNIERDSDGVEARAPITRR